MSAEYQIQYLQYVVAKLRKCSYIPADAHVKIGEYHGIDEWRDDKFPFIQLQPRKTNDRGYEDSQGFLENDFDISVQGFVRRPADDTTDEDTFELMRFQSEVNELIFELHADIQNGVITIPTFEQLSGFSETWFTYETFAKTSTFEFVFAGKFYQPNKS